MVIAASHSGAASPAVNVIDGVCDEPVKLERFGELASWQTKQPLAEMTPFAVESHDTLAWLYVYSVYGRTKINAAEFSAHKLKLKEAFRAMPGLDFVDDDTHLTAAYEGEAFISGQNQAATFGVKFTLVGGCVFSTFITKAGHGHQSEVVALFDLIQLSN